MLLPPYVVGDDFFRGLFIIIIIIYLFILTADGFYPVMFHIRK
jgi:hypothetical protein